MRRILLRTAVVITVLLGANYIGWRWLYSLNWDAWWIALALVVVETYFFIDVALFGLTMWRTRVRAAPTEPPDGLSVDVFITTFDESAELVSKTARAAALIRYPHKTWILDDGARDEMRMAADALGVGYITRAEGWKNRPLHAKAGNLNNALVATDGEFLLILDADQVVLPEFLDHTLGYFEDPAVAIVQTPQVFGNIPIGDPFGSQAPLFYGPIQQGRDGWNAACFCGSNAVLRRESLMQLGVTNYVAEVEHAVVSALAGASKVLARAHAMEGASEPIVQESLREIESAVEEARTAVMGGWPIDSATFRLQQRIDAVSRAMVAVDLHLMAIDLAAIREMRSDTDETWDVITDVDKTIETLASRELSPLGALTSVQKLLSTLDVDRDGEAQPLMPLATISVTEDIATSMRLHELGWKSVYHHETLATGLAPEDLGTILKQRLRWAQGTMQVMMLENPLVQHGLSWAQRLMYFSSMWGYLSGFAALVLFATPVVFLCFGILPIATTPFEFFVRFLPFVAANLVLSIAAGPGISTWRGQQYSLALFPVWIKATTSAIRSTYFHRPIAFAVTSKVRQDSAHNWRLVKPQICVAIVLVAAVIIGMVRVELGVSDVVATLINVGWVAFDLAILSVLVGATRYRGQQLEGAST